MATCKGTILVVDDEESIRQIVARKLQSDGYKCILASNGDEALDMVSTHDFDLVIMDIKMPGMSGIEALPHMSFNQPDICVVMTTGINDTQTTVEAMNLGAYDYVLKPFDLDDLSMRVEMALERKKVILENRARAIERYSALVENIADAVFEVKKGVITWCNDKVVDILGYSAEELIGKELKGFFPGDIILPDAQDGDWCTSGSTVLKRSDGQIIHIEYSISQVVGKEPVEVIAVLRNVTERKKALDKAKMAEENYRTIFENTAVAITVTDVDENIVAWNKLAEKLLGMNKDDLYMKPVKSLYPEEEWQKIRLQNVRQKGMQYHMETKVIRKDKQIIDVDLSVNVLKDFDGKVTGSIGVMSDLTEIMRCKTLKEEWESMKKDVERKDLRIREAEENIRLLGSLLPICPRCKEIHDTQDYLNKVESYISTHTEDEYRDSMCSRCKDFGNPTIHDAD